MDNSHAANKKIAKNTIYLYIRMFATLVVGLYTSRIVLRELGITDYGINNVVSSLLTLFTFIQGSLSSAASRFFAFEIGKGEGGDLNKIYCLTVNIHIIFSIAILVLCETLGVWYVNNMLVVPTDRFFAALVVYQMSVIGSILTLMVVPNVAMIIAQEHMSAFAYLSIVNVLFKLLVAYILCVTPIDKLITLSILGVCICGITNMLYVLYCTKIFKEECKYRRLWDARLFKEMMAYSGWSIASYAPVVVTQLSNLLINAFFGPVVNAARAVANTVQQNVISFVANFQIALNPQIIKNYAANDRKRVFELVNMSQKISFSLMFILFFPILTNVNFLLNLWLVEVPVYTDTLVVLVAISSIFLTIVNPLGVIAEAANRLKIANIIAIPYYAFSVLFVYIALRMGCDVIGMFSLFAIFDILFFLVSLSFTYIICKIPLRNQLFFYFRALLAVLLGCIIGYYIIDSIMIGSFVGFILKTCASVLFSLIIIMFIILSKGERIMVLYLIRGRLRKHFVGC